MAANRAWHADRIAFGVENRRRGTKLLDSVRTALQLRHYSPRTERAYCGLIVRYIVYHGKRHPSELGAREVQEFLAHLARDRRVSASTQNQALAALLFLYNEVLAISLERQLPLIRAARPERLPTVLAPREVAALLEQVSGPSALVVRLLYGAGLRLLEALQLRIKDVDFERRELIVRSGKGARDRRAPLPVSIVSDLRSWFDQVKRQHELDVRDGAGYVALPQALRNKYSNANREWPWQWCFPATRPYLHEPTGERRRHHLHETVVQKAIRQAARAASPPSVSAATPSVTPSPRISSKAVTTSAPSKSSSAIATWPRP